MKARWIVFTLLVVMFLLGGSSYVMGQGRGGGLGGGPDDDDTDFPAFADPDDWIRPDSKDCSKDSERTVYDNTAGIGFFQISFRLINRGTCKVKITGSSTSPAPEYGRGDHGNVGLGILQGAHMKAECVKTGDCNYKIKVIAVTKP